MSENYPQKQMKRIFRSKLTFGLIFFIIALFFVLTLGINVIGGYAHPESGTDIERVYRNGDKEIEISGIEFWDSGYYVTGDGSGKVYVLDTSEYDIYLICKVPNSMTEDYGAYTARGRLVEPAGAYKDAWRAIISDFADYYNIDYYDALEYFSPYILETGNPMLVELIIVIIAAAVAIFCIIQIFRGAYFITNYKNAKSYRKLAPNDPYGADLIADRISYELESANVRYYNKNAVAITDSFVATQTAFTYRVRRREDVKWIYKTVTQHRYNGIPTGKTYAITIHFADKSSFQIPSKKKSADEALAEIASVFPKAYIGYTDAMMKAWRNKDPNVFDEFVRNSQIQ